MSNMVRKGDFLVFVNSVGRVTEFFVSTYSFDLDNARSSGRLMLWISLGKKSLLSTWEFVLGRQESHIGRT